MKSRSVDFDLQFVRRYISFVTGVVPKLIGHCLLSLRFLPIIEFQSTFYMCKKILASHISIRLKRC